MQIASGTDRLKDRIKGAGRRISSGRRSMAGTNPFSMGNLMSNPKFNFIDNLAEQYDDDIYNNHLSFLDNEDVESPYNSNTFSCSYVDTNQLCNQICSNNNLNIMSFNIQSLSAKFHEFCELLDECSSKNASPDIILLQELWQIVDPCIFAIKGYQPLIFKC
jgi:hypothetical protein